MWVRPDGRCFVRRDELGLASDRELYVTVDEEDADALERCAQHGFVAQRRESRFRLSTTAHPAVGVPAGFVFVQADMVDEGRLRTLDDLLRQDVPGTDGWCWDEAGFRDELQQPAFDASLYLVAQDVSTGEYAGIARVWNNPGTPRLGFIGVVRRLRRRGLAHALVAQVFAVLAARGQLEVTTEIDDTNVASNALLAAFDAQRIGGSVELVRRPV